MTIHVASNVSYVNDAVGEQSGTAEARQTTQVKTKGQQQIRKSCKSNLLKALEQCTELKFLYQTLEN